MRAAVARVDLKLRNEKRSGDMLGRAAEFAESFVIDNFAINENGAALGILGVGGTATDIANALSAQYVGAPSLSQAEAGLGFDAEFRSVLGSALPVKLAGTYDKGAAIADANKNVALRAYKMTGNDSSVLSWLDIHTDAVDDDLSGAGAVLQPSPHGDNINILDARQVKTADVGRLGARLAQLGEMRFDTVLVRNLMFIVNLYRAARMKLQKDLMYSREVIMRSTPITRPQLTEFYGNVADHSRQSYRFNEGSMYKF
jgi:hypothetical protein